MAVVLFVTVGVLLRLICVGGSAAPGVIYAAAPSERGSYHVGGKGVYNYGYNTGDGIAKVEVRHADGSVTGSYRYFDPLGRQIVRSYIADKRGFRVLGNELPVSPDTPVIGIPEAQVLTGPVEGAKEFTSPNLIDPERNALLFQNTIDESPFRTYNYLDQNNAFRRSYVTLKDDFESPYFYSPDNIVYDFPAGFAYPAMPAKLILRPFGVTGEHENRVVSAGHSPKRIRMRPILVTRGNKISNYQRRPYIIGHTK